MSSKKELYCQIRFPQAHKIQQLGTVLVMFLAAVTKYLASIDLGKEDWFGWGRYISRAMCLGLSLPQDLVTRNRGR